MMYWGNHMGTGDWIFSILGTVIIIGLIIGLIIWVTSGRGQGASGAAATSEPAREILDRRLASGEITLEQHEHLTQALADGGSSAHGPRPAQPSSTPV